MTDVVATLQDIKLAVNIMNATAMVHSQKVVDRVATTSEIGTLPILYSWCWSPVQSIFVFMFSFVNQQRMTVMVTVIFIGPILWGHSGPLCHALSLTLLLLSMSLSWTSMRRRRATVATRGEWRVRRLAVANGPNIFQGSASCCFQCVLYDGV